MIASLKVNTAVAVGRSVFSPFSLIFMQLHFITALMLMNTAPTPQTRIFLEISLLNINISNFSIVELNLY